MSYQDIVVLAKPEWNRPRGGTVDSSQFSTPHPLPSRVTRSMEVDVDRLGNEVILMHLSNLELRLLNEVGTILWEALEVIPEPSELVEMLVESHPNQSRETHAANVAVFIDELARAGFLTVEASGGLDVP